MSIDAERRSRLYFDPSCGPCRLFATAVEGAGHGRIEAVPFDGRAAEVDLSALAPEARFGSAHWVEAGARRSGDDIVPPLVRATLGPTAAHLVDRAPVLDRSLRRLYRWFWRAREKSGCGTHRP